MALLVIGLSSLGMTTFVNRYAGIGLQRFAPDLTWIADATIPSFLVSLLIYLAIHPAHPFGLPAPRTDWRRIARASVFWLAVWLTASVIVPLTVGTLTAYIHGAAPVAGFIVIAPLAEEMLFRGAIFELSERAFLKPSSISPNSSSWFPAPGSRFRSHTSESRIGSSGEAKTRNVELATGERYIERNTSRTVHWVPIVVSTTLFSLHHFELHQFLATHAALTQVAFTIPMGLLWGVFRSRSESIWPGYALHVLTNLPGAFGA
jgi:membrane protease YdiL (CAAX protease family)